MLDTNKTELKQVIMELQELKVMVEKGENVNAEIKTISNRVTDILNGEQQIYASTHGTEYGGTVVNDEKLNALFSANAYLHTKPRTVDEMRGSIESAIGKLMTCIL